MNNLKKASHEMFRRSPDECFTSLTALWEHCYSRKEADNERWVPPVAIRPTPSDLDTLLLNAGSDGAFLMNDWSFGQLCRLANVGKETVNRLTPETASRVFGETLPRGTKPLQLLTTEDHVRAIHGTAYTRLYDVDLLTLVREFAVDFEAPPKGVNGGTGLYAGEQDMFLFLIDPTGWAEIGGNTFAPGFFLWNSEVGRRSLGISTFWFQAVCGNHIVWDAIEVVEFTRKHTTKVHDALCDVRRIIESLVNKRDARRDGFVQVIRKAMNTRLGDDVEEATKAVAKHGVRGQLAKKAIEFASRNGGLTVFAVVDALTQLSQELHNAGSRTEADQRAAKLLVSVA